MTFDITLDDIFREGNYVEEFSDPGAVISLYNEAINVKDLVKKGVENIQSAWRWLVRSIKYLWSCIYRRMKAHKSERLIRQADELMQSEGYAVYDFNDIPGDDYEGMFEGNQMAIVGNYTETDIKNFAMSIIKNKKLILSVGKHLCPGVGQAVMLANAAKAAIKLTPILTDFITTSKEIALLKRKYAGKIKRVKNPDGSTYCELPSEAYITVDKYAKLANRIIQFLSQGGKKETVTITIRNTDDLIKCGKNLMGKMETMFSPEEEQAIAQYYEAYNQDIEIIRKENEGESDLPVVSPNITALMKNDKSATIGAFLTNIFTMIADAAAGSMQIYVKGEEYRINGQKLAAFYAPITTEILSLAMQMAKDIEEMEAAGQNCVVMFLKISQYMLPGAAKMGVKLATNMNKNGLNDVDILTKVKKESGNLVDFVLEQFRFDPVEAVNIDPYYSTTMFEDGQHFLEETIKEASTGVTKKNIFQKLWEGIKRIFAWCAKQWARFTQWVQKVFPKVRKTADQLADEILGGIYETMRPDTAFVNRRISGFDIGSMDKVVVDIPSSPRSEITLDPKIEVLMKPITLRYNYDKKHFGVTKNDSYRLNDGKVTGQSNGSYEGMNSVIRIILHPEILNTLIDALTILKSGNVGTEFLTKIHTFHSELNKSWRDFDNTVISFKDLNDFQIILNKIMALITDVTLDQNLFTESKEALDEFNKLSLFCARLQMGVNNFTRVMQSVYVIDAKYLGKIKTTDVLDKFVDAMINAGIPPKYIAYNTYLVCDQSLKGTKGDKDKPIWGQSRVVLFPEDKKDEVIKVALSGWGVQSNRSEYEFSKKITQAGGEDLIAITKELGASASTATAERVSTDEFVYANHINPYVDKLDRFVNDHGIPYEFYDIHSNNLGKKNGQIVLFDYSFVNRHMPGDLIKRT